MSPLALEPMPLDLSSPFEARLLAKSASTAALDVPAERGVALGLSIPSRHNALGLATAIAASPGSARLSPLPRRIVNQGTVQCCVSCALGGAMEVLRASAPALSPMFHYHVTRVINHGADTEGLLFLDKGIDTLKRQGICQQSSHPQPFQPAAVDVRPTDAAFSDALTRRIGRAGLRFPIERLVGSLSSKIRDHLRRNHPVVAIFALPMGYPAQFLDATHAWMKPATPPPSSSHHCVLLVGFDDARRAVRVFDSQGTDRFDAGTWWMGYDVVDGPPVNEVYALTA